MQRQTNDGPKQTQSQTKNQKKNKNKEKKRLMSLFRGPKVENKFHRKTTEEESNDIKHIIIDIISKNSSLKLHQNKKKNTSDQKNIETNETKMRPKLTTDLILGINAIIRSIEKKLIIGVILTNPLALPLEDNIIELCSNNQIHCLSVQSFDEIKSCLNISSLSGIAFKPNVVSIDSIFHELYEKFRSILNFNSLIESIEPKNIKHDNEEVVAKEEKTIKMVSKTNKSEVTIDKSHPLFVSLYSKKSEDNYRLLFDKYLKENESNRKRDEFLTQESLIKFSSKPVLEFPETEDINKHSFKIEVISDEQTIDSNESFAESLMESMDETVPKSLKRKFNESTEGETLQFKTPRIVRLEPSAQKIKNRKQRKQMKKVNRCQKKS